MKQLRKPTREQRKLIQQKRLNPADWMVERDTPEKMELVHPYICVPVSLSSLCAAFLRFGVWFGMVVKK